MDYVELCCVMLSRAFLYQVVLDWVWLCWVRLGRAPLLGCVQFCRVWLV